MSGRITIGVFIPCGAQLLDVAAVDVLGVMSKEYFATASDIVPPPIFAAAPEVIVYYISTPSLGGEIPLTSGAILKPTHTYKDDAVAPGKLDIVLVPGPDPACEPDEGGLEWLRRQNATKGVDILSVCTGLYICGAAGIADGKLASGPRGVQDDLRKKFPKVKLVGANQRWVQDGNFWSSGGITNGNDLVAAYARLSGRWDQSVVQMGLAFTEVDDRGQFYPDAKAE